MLLLGRLRLSVESSLRGSMVVTWALILANHKCHTTNIVYEMMPLIRVGNMLGQGDQGARPFLISKLVAFRRATAI